MDKVLEQNISAYGRVLGELLAEHPGEVVLIQDARVAGTYGSYEAAMTAGYQQFGHSGFFVQRIEPLQLTEDEPRSAEACRP